ncbi:Uncharacterised protein [Mycobacteroides abscessus subsp. abscessus]|nr:Uncharacterised protein [Mycobacteroides abscessus subsp. abscessus]
MKNSGQLVIAVVTEVTYGQVQVDLAGCPDGHRAGRNPIGDGLGHAPEGTFCGANGAHPSHDADIEAFSD